MKKNFTHILLKEYIIDEFKKVVLLEDTFALYIGIEEDNFPVYVNAKEIYSWTLNNEFMDMPLKGEKYYVLRIEELNYNSLGFKYNHSKFIRLMQEITGISYLGSDITYTKFRGYTRLYWCLDTTTLAEEINIQLPQLRLRERYEAWEGINYYFIVIELDSIKGVTEYAVAYTTQKPHSYIVAKCKDVIKTGSINGDMRFRYTQFQEAFKSWKGIRRQERLEKHMRYFYFEKRFREKDDVWRYADEILKNVYKGMYFSEERSTYTRPVNKWVSEEQVFTIVKKLYKEFNVIYQHRPFFLRSSMGGQMSYDVFISGLNIAVEYQGKQHFEPVEYFGGESAFQRTVERDKEKLELSIKNNVKILYINYWEVITPKLVQNKINSLISNGIDNS